MNFHKLFRILIFTQLLLTGSFVITFAYEHIPAAFMYVVVTVQLIVLFCTYYFIFLPSRKLNNILDRCLDEKAVAEELLDSKKDSVPYVKKIKDVVDVCSTNVNRDNYATIFDKQAELAALQSQINPHFLYNTLDTIRGQAMIDDNLEIADMVEALAGFFRYGISRKGELVTLREEIANMENYMKIQQYRFNNRFSLEIVMDKEDEITYDYLVPRLIIQPIIENAITHGLKQTLKNGIITIEVILTKKNLILMISDNGKGMDSKTLKQINERIKEKGEFIKKGEEYSEGTGIALPNINKRIKLLFGESYGINIYSTLEFGTDVEVILPVNHRRGVSS